MLNRAVEAPTKLKRHENIQKGFEDTEGTKKNAYRAMYGCQALCDISGASCLGNKTRPVLVQDSSPVKTLPFT